MVKITLEIVRSIEFDVIPAKYVSGNSFYIVGVITKRKGLKLFFFVRFLGLKNILSPKNTKKKKRLPFSYDRYNIPASETLKQYGHGCCLADLEDQFLDAQFFRIFFYVLYRES